MKTLVAILALSAVGLAQTPQPEYAEHVSMIQLIATPERFDGKKIMLIGYVNLEFEGDAIYFHKDDFDYGNVKNSIWLTLSPAQSDRYEKLSGNYLLIEGVYDKDKNGHMGLFSGSIRNVTRFTRTIRSPEPKKETPNPTAR